jgi:hypothetical protein
VIVGDRDCSEVEGLVVQRTEGKTVLDHVRAAVREPLHVRGHDADADLADLSVVRADRAPVLVSAQHRWSEAGVAPRAPCVRLGGSFGDANVQTDLRQDVWVERGREVLVENRPSDARHEFRVGAQGSVHRFGEPAADSIPA